MALLANIPILWSPLTIITVLKEIRYISTNTDKMHAKEKPHSISYIDEKQVSLKPTFCIAVGIYWMVCKSNFVALACCINHKICKGQKKQNAQIIF